MAVQPRRGGLISLSVNGRQMDVVGDLEYDLGGDTQEGMVGSTGVQGYKTMPRIPFFACQLRDHNEFDLALEAATNNATVIAELANGKTVQLRDAWAAGEWTAGSEEGIVNARWEGSSAGEV